MSTPPPPRPGAQGPGSEGQQQGSAGQVPRNSMTLPAPLAGLPATVWRWIGGFVAAFLVSTIGSVLLMGVFLAASDTGSSSDAETDEMGVVPLVALGLVHAWTGHVSAGYEDETFGGGGGMTTPLTTAAVLAVVALGLATTWLTRRYRPASRTAVWGQVVAAVAACLLCIVVLGLIGRPSGDGFSMSALSFGSMFRLAVVLMLTALVGVAAAVPRGHRVGALFGDSAQRVVEAFRPSADAALLHLGAWSVIGLVGGVFAAIVIRDDVSIGVSLLYLPSAIPIGMSWAHLGGIGFSMEGSQDLVDFLPDDLAHGMSWTIFSEDSPWVLWLLPVVALVVITLIATRLTLLRAPGSSVDVRHVAATALSLPLLWFVVVRLIGSLSASMDMAGFGEDVGGDIAAGAAWWTYIMLILTGVGIEVVHVLLGVRLVQSLPRGLVQRLVPNPHQAWGPYLGGAPSATPGNAGPAAPAAGQGAAGYGARAGFGREDDEPTVASAAQDADEETAETPAATATSTAWGGPGSGQPAWGQPRPVSARTKIVIGGVVGALAVLALGWFLVGQVGKRYFGPDGVALDYASAVVEGRASDAVEAGNVNVADRHRLLLDDDVYSSVKGRPDAAQVTDVKESDDGKSATVTVEFEQEGQRFEQELEAERAGRQKLFFPKWELEPVELPSASLTVMSDEVKVGEHTLKIADNARPGDERLAPLGSDAEIDPGYRVNLPALPGTYSFDLPESKVMETDPVDVDITADAGAEDGGTSEGDTTLAPRPGGDFEKQVNAQIKKKIDDCVSSYDESTCPWGTSFDDPADYSGRSFSPESYPTASVPDTESFGEGEAIALDVEGGEITEKATCRSDLVFSCAKGKSDETSTYFENYGWYATVDGDDVTVGWTDEY